ncbi:MAG: hypothetical protein GY716_07335 [bacterium]|nr:hypothetical protein [bacterium]
MKKNALLLAAILMAGLVGGTNLAEEPTTLNGEFNWTQRGTKGELEAVFTPTGENSWDVAFHFEFRGEPHIYAGTAEGNLKKGRLKGSVKNDNKKRTFTFDGKVKDGVFQGTHAETTGGKPIDTGTLKLGG